MTCWSWLAGLCLLLQVPPPTLGAETAQRLEAARRSIILREAFELGALAERLAREGKSDAAKLVRAELPQVGLPNGPTRFLRGSDSTLPKAGSTLQTPSLAGFSSRPNQPSRSRS